VVRRPEPAQTSARSLVVEIGRARLLIGEGFERSALATVLELLAALPPEEPR